MMEKTTIKKKFERKLVNVMNKKIIRSQKNISKTNKHNQVFLDKESNIKKND